MAKDKGKKKVAARKARKPFFGNLDNAPEAVLANASADDDGKTIVKKKPLAKKKASAKPYDKTKTAKAKKVVKKDEAEVAAKNPASKETPAKKKPVTAASAKDKAKAAVAAKKPAAKDCKAGADGKLPAGCKAASATKKPVAKPTEKVTAAN